MKNKNIVWIVGKSIEVDIFWGFCDYKNINNLNEIYNNNLFEQENYKYIMKKNDSLFFKKNPEVSSYVLIKGIEKKENFMDAYIVYEIDELKLQELLELFINFYQLNFSKEQLEFVYSNCSNLADLVSINYLKTLDLSMKKWNFILNENISTNWFELFKNNCLISKAILNESEAIPVLQFLNKMQYNKKYFTQFLSASIKSGDKIWEHNSIWKKLL